MSISRVAARNVWAGVLLGGVLAGAMAEAQTPSAKDVVNTMLVKEREAAEHKDNYMYLSNERSDRTGGKLWTEHVVETKVGRVRYLVGEEGKPLPQDRVDAEKARLANDAAHPEDFIKREQAQKDDELHARQLLELVPRGFILENMKELNGAWRIDFRPDPNYSPSGVEEHVLHAMSGWMLVDEKQMRLRYIEGRLPQDVSVYGFLASVKAGSHFETTKAPEDGSWRTIKVQTDIRGKAVLFKSIGKSQDVARSEFKRVPNELTVAQAIELAEK